jgi:hypothetical protein
MQESCGSCNGGKIPAVVGGDGKVIVPEQSCRACDGSGKVTIPDVPDPRGK